MEHFVTLFDSLFLPQGLALYFSMQRNLNKFTLWIICVDDLSHSILSGLNLSNMRLLNLSEIETETLKKLKEERTKGEYCWTLTPFVPKFVFDSDNSVEQVTYLDADVWFRKNPRLIFKEFSKSEKSVLITDHAFAPEYDKSTLAGQYCVQFMTFRRGSSEIVRSWWQDRCVEWCFNRHEDGKFGDQKYLDDWPVRFADEVHVLFNKELILAPWNATRFPYGNSIVWHFHELRIMRRFNRWQVFLCGYRLPPVVIQNIYEPYLKDLTKAIDLLVSAGFAVQAQKTIGHFSFIRNILSSLRSIIFSSAPKQIISL
jgi:hypothetical protein